MCALGDCWEHLIELDSKLQPCPGVVGRDGWSLKDLSTKRQQGFYSVGRKRLMLFLYHPVQSVAITFNNTAVLLQ